MASTEITSRRPSHKVAELILTLCPGGPVGAVMSREGRLLLPRRISIDQVVLERRKPGLPPGRIVIGLAPSGSGTLVRINFSGEPMALVLSSALIAGVSVVAAQLAGGAVGVGIGALLAAIETIRWRKGLAGLATDTAWLTEQLRRT